MATKGGKRPLRGERLQRGSEHGDGAHHIFDVVRNRNRPRGGFVMRPDTETDRGLTGQLDARRYPVGTGRYGTTDGDIQSYRRACDFEKADRLRRCPLPLVQVNRFEDRPCVVPGIEHGPTRDIQPVRSKFDRRIDGERKPFRRTPSRFDSRRRPKRKADLLDGVPDSNATTVGEAFERRNGRFLVRDGVVTGHLIPRSRRRSRIESVSRDVRRIPLAKMIAYGSHEEEY